MDHQNGHHRGNSAPNGPSGHRCEHSAHLYTDSASLCRAIADYIGPALDRGEAAIVIATPTHTQGLTRSLEASGRDIESAIQSGQLDLVDAEVTLKSILIGAQPDREAFHALLVGGIEDRLKRFGGLCAYGELVNLLWHQDNRPAAHQLEQWWNELIDQFSFSLMCGYRSHVLDARAQSELELICQTHTRLATLLDGDRFEKAFDSALQAVIPTGDTQSIRNDLVARCRHRTRMSPALAALSALHELLPSVAQEVRLKVQDNLRRTALTG